MERKIKRTSIIVLIILLLLVGAGLFIIYYNDTNAEINEEGKVKDEKEPKSVVKAKPAVKIEAEKEKLSKETAEEIYKDRKFDSDEEIKQEFGRLEIVYLFNGQHFTGYVVSVDDFYSMVTVDGFKKFPMKDVKCRVIIN